MRTDIRYVNNQGREMVFGGTDEALHYFKHELLENTWTYDTGVSKTRITSFGRAIETKSFPVGIAAETNEEGIRKRNEIMELGELDIIRKQPGRLYVGDWYIQCWIVGVSFDQYWMSDRFAEITLTLLIERCEWTQESLLQFQPSQNITTSTKGGDFAYDFDHDYMGSLPSKELNVSSIGDCDFLWRVYGSATNPYMMIGSNIYRVNTTVPSGGRLEVDSRAKTIKLIGADGLVSDEYSLRARGAKGSGSYIFERIKPGTTTVSWDNTFTFDLVIYRTRSLPPFELEA